MAKNKLPEGYKGVDKLIEEFRKDNPKGKIETSPVLLGDGYVIITAKVTKDDGAIGSGMADADVQDDKSVEKAESGAIRRAMLTLGYKSVEADDAADQPEEKEEKQEKKESRFGSKGLKRQADEQEETDQDEQEEEEKPRSRFGNKGSAKEESKSKAKNEDEEQEEGESRFKRGSRFQRG